MGHGIRSKFCFVDHYSKVLRVPNVFIFGFPHSFPMNGHVAKLAFPGKKTEMRLEQEWRFLIRLFTENPAFVPQSRPDHFGSQQTP